MSPGNASHLFVELRARLDRFVQRIGPLQAEHVKALLERHRYLDSEGALFDPLGHPVVVLGSWISRRSPDSTLLDIAESSLCGYLHVRLQDDLLDDEIGPTDAVLLLGDSLLTRHLGLLARSVASADFWDMLEVLWANYAEAMLFERSLPQSPLSRQERDFDRLLDRSMPLAIPGLAVLALEDRWHESEAVMRMTRSIVRSGQLVTDLIDAPNDLAAGRMTWMVSRLGGTDGATSLRRGMISQFDAVIADARAALDDARNAADDLDSSTALEWIDLRLGRLGDLAESFYTSVFSSLLDAPEE